MTVQNMGQWGITSDLTIGQAGDGNVTLQGGGTISVGGNLDIAQQPNSVGVLTINGGSTTFECAAGSVTIGDGGMGSMSVLNSASVDFSAGQGVTLGNQSMGQGTLTVTGGSTTLSVLDLTIGNAGKGTVLVNTGGTLNVDGDLDIGQAAASAGTLTVDGATTNLILTGAAATKELDIGDAGAGTLIVQNAAFVDLTNIDPVVLGNQTTGKGAITVTGDTSEVDVLDLTIGNNGAGSVSVSSNATLTTFAQVMVGSISTGSGTLSITGGGSIWNPLGNITIGGGGAGTLNITGGAAVDASLIGGNSFVIGDQSTGTGTVTISDGGSSFVSSGDVVVGNGGGGTLNIINNGTMTVMGNLTVGSQSMSTGLVSVGASASSGTPSIGSLTVNKSLIVGAAGNGDLEINGNNVTVGANGGGSLVIGDQGSGTIAIHGNSDLNAAGASSILLGNQSTGNGTLIIDGPLSAFDFGSVPLTIGVQGTGTLKIINGGGFTIGSLTLGSMANATGNLIVDGTNAISNAGVDSLTIGGSGTGSVTVQSGGQLLSQDVVISQSSGSSKSAAMVTGTGSLWTISHNLTIGQGDAGSMTISSGATVTVANALTVGTAPLASSTLNVTGGGTSGSQATLTYGGGLNIGSAGLGSMSITGGAIVSNLSPASTMDSIGSQGGGGTVTVSGAGSAWTSGFLQVSGLGSQGQSLMVLSGGTVNSPNGAQVMAQGGAVTVKVDGSANGTPSTWTIGDGGFNGPSTLWAPTTISNGGQIICDGTTFVGTSDSGTININTAGELLLKPEGSGVAELPTVCNVIVDGGTLSSTGGFDFLGSAPVIVRNGGVITTTSESGTDDIECPVTVQNGGSLSLPDITVVGFDEGAGTLEIDSGGVVTSTAGGVLVIGGSSPGTLSFNGGGSLTVYALQIGGGVGQPGYLTMNDSSDSITVTNNLSVGTNLGGPNVPVSITVGGGSIIVGNTVTVGDFLTASSLILNGASASLSAKSIVINNKSTLGINGGATATMSSLTLMPTATLNVVGGSCTVGTGAAAPAGTVMVYKDGTFTEDGNVVGSVVIVQGKLTAINNDPPTINANLEVDSGGVLDMVVAGSDSSSYAHLTVSGTTSVAGTVLLDFQNGFAPKAGDAFDLFTVAGGMSSLGSDIQVAGLAQGWQYTVQDENGDTYVDSLSDGVATSPEPSSVALGMAIFAGTALRPPRRSRRGGMAVSAVTS